MGNSFDVVFFLTGSCALFYASRQGHCGLVDALLKAGADVNGSRVTALLIASRFGHASAVVKLMHAGADVTAVDDDGNTGELFGYFLVIFGYFWLFLVIFVWAIGMTSCFIYSASSMRPRNHAGGGVRRQDWAGGVRARRRVR